MPEPSFQDDLSTRYRAARALVADAAALVLLYIGAEQTVVVVGLGAAPDAVLTLSVGSNKTARDHFKHTPPSPLELENTIATVEDEVTRERHMVSAGARLCTTDAAIREIARLSGVTEGATMRLSLDAMERTFDRFSQVSLGRPASLEGLPASNTFAATLLILREFMHHLQFADITVLMHPSEGHPSPSNLSLFV